MQTKEYAKNKSSLSSASWVARSLGSLPYLFAIFLFLTSWLKSITSLGTIPLLAIESIFVLVPLVVKYHSYFVRFHITQGVFLALLFVLLSGAIRLLSLSPEITILLGSLPPLLLIINIVMMFSSLSGKTYQLPFLGGFVKNLS